MADTVSQLAYDEATTAITSQAGVLDNLRSRAGTLLAAASLVTSFLGGQALAKPVLAEGVVSKPTIEFWGWVAVGAFVGVFVLTIAVLWPYEWRFVMSPSTILQAGPGETQFQTAQVALAQFHEQNYDTNQAKLDLLFWAFRLACAMLALETVAWILDFGG